MNYYGVTFKHDGGTVLIEAEFYDISEGFLRFYKSEIKDRPPVEFAAYSSDSILHCVKKRQCSDLNES